MANTAEPDTPTKTPVWKKKWFWVAIGTLFVIGGIGNLASPAKDETDTSQKTATVEPSTPKPSTEQPKPAPEPALKSAPVADAEALWLSMHNVESPTDFLAREGYENSIENPLYAVQTGWGGSTDGYLEIQVQEPLTESSVEKLGRGVLNFIGPQYPDVDGVVFTDSNGRDWNFFRKDAPLADK